MVRGGATHRRSGVCDGTSEIHGCDGPPDEALRRGAALFNQRAFYAQHEVLEDAWRAEAGPVRDLFRGILQVGVGCYHLSRGNHRGACNLLRYGLARLEPFEPVCLRVDVTALRSDAARALAALEDLGPERLDEFNERLLPQVVFVEAGPA
jgi:hypothetical protein